MRSNSPPGHTAAILQALFVTFLWSTSWVLIKIGLRDVPPLTFAGLRYSAAFVCLIPWMLTKPRRSEVASLRLRDWLALCALGLVFYTFTQGAQFLALVYLPAQTTSLFLSFSPVVVAIGSALLIGETPRVIQVAAVGLYLAGAAVFILPVNTGTTQTVGFVIAGAGVAANSAAAILGRHVNRQATMTPLTVTTVSMGIGGLILLVVGVATQGLPRLGAQNLLIIGVLAVVNTAFAFTLWNHTLRRLRALESSLINNTMLIQIAILAWVFLSERLGSRQILGLVMAAGGGMMAQPFAQSRRADS